MDQHILVFEGGFIKTFYFFGVAIPSYSFFVLMGLIVGGVVLMVLNNRMEIDILRGDHSFVIVGAALIGGVLGAKLPLWIMYFDQIFGDSMNLMKILSGRTIMGGLIGGFIAVQLTKRILKIKRRTGNQLAPAIAIGMAIGRLGCFFQGCCAGIVTTLPWGVDFGDGYLRQPTQIYEVIFHTICFVVLLFRPEIKKEGGSLLTVYFMSYFVYRFFSEFIRINPEKYMTFTVYQWLCLAGILLMGWKMRKDKINSVPKFDMD